MTFVASITSFSDIPLPYTSFGPYALNSLGAIGGSLANGDQAAIWRNQIFTLLPTPAGSGISDVNGLNDLGVAVGLIGANSGPADELAIQWTSGGFTLLSTPAGMSSEADAINNPGQIVGTLTAANGSTEGALWQNGVLTVLQSLGGSSASARSINTLGQIAGTAWDSAGQEHAVIWQNGSAAPTDIGQVISGGSTFIQSYAVGINNEGQVVGNFKYINIGGDDQAFLWQNGQTTSLADLILGGASDVSAINDSGIAVGDSSTTTANTYSYDAVMWVDGQVIDLNSLLPANSGWSLQDAVTINDAGQITGYGTFQGVFTSFLMTVTQSSATTAPATSATPQDLGYISGYYGLTGLHINDQGQIAGIAGQVTGTLTVTSASEGFVWQNGTLTGLAPLSGGFLSEAYSINNSGDVVGLSASNSAGVFSGHAVIWRGGVASALGELAGDVGSLATGINDQDQVIGISIGSSGEHGVLWSGGQITNLGSLGGTVTSPFGINDSGEIVGAASIDGTNSVLHAFLWQNGQITDLGLPENTVQSLAYAIDASGEIAGYAVSSVGTSEAVVWKNGAAVALPLLPGSVASVAESINESGIVAGYVELSNGTQRAVVWIDGLVHDLNGLMSDAVGLWDLTQATAINSLGDVTGVGTNNGQSAAFEFTLPSVTVTAAQALQAQSTGLLTVPLTIADSAADISASLDQLDLMAGEGLLTGITLTGATSSLAVTASQFAADQAALKTLSATSIIEISGDTPGTSLAGLAGHANSVVFSGDSTSYDVTAVGDGTSLVVTGAAVGTERLSGVQSLRFADVTEIVAAQPGNGTVTSGNIAELYGAVFGREPDVAGLAFYETYAASHPGTSLLTYAGWFLASPEYTGNTAHAYAQTNAGEVQFITDSYQNLLGRTPDADEVSYYQSNVIAPALAGLTPGTDAYAAADAQAHAQMLVYFSASPEFLTDVQITAAHPASTHYWLRLI